MENQKGHNNKKTKTIILSICALLAVGIGVFLTYSYLNITSNEVTNTFVVGDDFTAQLDELAMGGNGRLQKFSDAQGNITLADDESNNDEIPKTTDKISEFKSYRVTQNQYELAKNCLYLKDPTLHVSPNGCKYCAFIKVCNPLTDILTDKHSKGDNDKYRSIEEQLTDYHWKEITFDRSITEPNDTNEYKYYYYSESEDNTLSCTSKNELPIFKTFYTKDDNIANSYKNAELKILAAVIKLTGSSVSLENAWKSLPTGFKSTT